MWKVILTAVTALTIAGWSLINAQQPPSVSPGASPDRHELSPEDQAAFLNARVAALKAGLGLSAAQERNWSAFEQAIRDLAKLRADRKEAWRNATPPSDPIERLRRRADSLSRTGATLKQLADAGQPLYQTQDEGQKRRFIILAHHLWPSRGHHHEAMSERSHEQPDRNPER